MYLKEGWLSVSRKRIPLDKVQETSYSQSVVERQFRCGTVQISTAGYSGNDLVFSSIENAKQVQENISALTDGETQQSNSRDTTVSESQDVAEELRKTREELQELAEKLP